MKLRFPDRRALFAGAVVLTLAACGTRVSQSEVLAGAGGSTVSLDPASITALRAAAGGGAAAPASAASGAGTAGTAVVAPSGAAAAPTTTGGRTAAGSVATTKPTSTRTPAGQARSAAAAPVAAAESGCTGAGAPLKLGQIGSFSGVAGPITASARTALATWVQAVNAGGGIACHPVVLYSEDDGADPSKAAALVQELVQDKGVQALVGVFSALSFQGILSGVEKAKIPVIGGDGFDLAWNENRYLFPVGAGILGNVRGAVRQTVASGKTKAGLLYCVESSVCTNIAKIIDPEVRAAGATLVYSSAVSLTQTDFTAQCQNAKNAGAQAIGMALDGATIGRVARSCAAINYRPQIVTNGQVLSPQNAADPDVRRNTLSSAGSVAPWMVDDTPGQREYHAALAKYAPNAAPDASSISAWAAGKLLEAAIKGLGAKARTAPITTADIFTGLGTINRETLAGLTPPITFSPGQKAAPLIECVYFELLSEKGWSAPRGSAPVCR